MDTPYMVTVYVSVIIFVVVLFSQIFGKFLLQYMAIYSNENIFKKITKLSPREFPP